MKKLSISIVSAVLLPLSIQAQVASFSIPAQTIEQNAQNVQIPIHLDNSRKIYAFSFALEVTRSQLRMDRIDLAGTVASGADWSFGQHRNGRGRLYWGVIIDDSNPITGAIPAGNDQLLAKIVVDSRPEAAGETTIRFRNASPDLSSTPVDPGGQNVAVDKDGAAVSLGLTDGRITTVVPGTEVGPFLRGDCNQNGDNVELTDAVFYLESVFSGRGELVCRAACDFNGDGLVEASPTDALFYLNWAFSGIGTLPQPLRCATSTRAGDIALGCENPRGCR